MFLSLTCPKIIIFTYTFVSSTAVSLIYYGLQHYLSLAGSLVLIPLVMVPVMGGTDVSVLLLFTIYYSPRQSIVLRILLFYVNINHWWQKDTATVISTMLFISGITTILHSYFGTRLPLVQGSSFVYLAPALVIINAQDYRNLTEHVSSYFINKDIILIRQILKVLNPGYLNCRNLGT
jgi:xanthine/uracil permease